MALQPLNKLPIYKAFAANREARAKVIVKAHRVIWDDKRDSQRQRCYDLDNKAFRKHATNGRFADRRAAKGFARLCANIALRRLACRHGLDFDRIAEIRGSFKAAITSEPAKWCNGNLAGIYMAKWAWDQATLAHEVAHWIDQWDDVLSRPIGAALTPMIGHGPKWRGWYSHLLVEACSFTPDYVAAAWADARLAVAMP